MAEINLEDYENFVRTKASKLFCTDRVPAPNMLGIMREVLKSAKLMEAARKMIYYGPKYSPQPSVAANIDDCTDHSHIFDYTKVDPDELHAAAGMLDEATEMLLHIVQVATGQVKPDRNNKLAEAGDLFFFFTLYLMANGFTLEQVIRANRSKLDQRYRESFNPTEAVHRLVSLEDAAVDKHLRYE